MTKQTNVSIRKIDNGWIYSIVEFDPMGGVSPSSQEHYADTLENVFDQLRRKVCDQNQAVRKPIPYPLSGVGKSNPFNTYHVPEGSTWTVVSSYAGWDTATPTEGPDKESDFFFDPRTGTVAGEEPDVLASFKEIWGTK